MSPNDRAFSFSDLKPSAELAVPRTGFESSFSRSDSLCEIGLAARLRLTVADIHHELETQTRIPDGILSMQDYISCLRKFYAIFAPVERGLARFDEWLEHGINFNACRRAPALIADLSRLGVGPGGLRELQIPRSTHFATALGALYVLEGSTLGGKVILRQLEARLGTEIAGASSFFGGGGRTGALTWPAFKARLDAFGESQPNAQLQVIAGALDTFRQFGLALKASSDVT